MASLSPLSEKFLNTDNQGIYDYWTPTNRPFQTKNGHFDEFQETKKKKLSNVTPK